MDEFQVSCFVYGFYFACTELTLQDTNTTQYELMKCFAKGHGGVSVVGDPDQSIYSWRAAEVENLNKMNDGELRKLMCSITLAKLTRRLCRY